MEDIVGEVLDETAEVTLKKVLQDDYDLPITQVGFSTDVSERYGVVGSVFDLENIPEEFLHLECVGYRIVEMKSIMYHDQLKLMLYVKLPLEVIAQKMLKNFKEGLIDFIRCL